MDGYYLQLYVRQGSELDSYREDIEEQELSSLGPVQRLNIFVGSTNSGKSRLMRGIMNNISFVLFKDKNLITALKEVLAISREFSSDVNRNKVRSVSLRYVIHDRR